MFCIALVIALGAEKVDMEGSVSKIWRSGEFGLLLSTLKPQGDQFTDLRCSSQKRLVEITIFHVLVLIDAGYVGYKVLFKAKEKSIGDKSTSFS